MTDPKQLWIPLFDCPKNRFCGDCDALNINIQSIETISEGGVQRQKYYYDSLNQLIREDKLDLNKTIVYSYDLGGNLTSTEEYAYQTGATVTGTPMTTNSYTYGDSNWKDSV